MNRKLMTLAAVMFAGCLGAAPLDLSGYVTSGRKDVVKNTGQIVTNVDAGGLAAAITQHVALVIGPVASGVTTLEGRTNDWNAAVAYGPRISAIEGRTNDWNAAFSWGSHALAGYLTQQSLDTNRVTRLFDTTGTQWIDGTGGVWLVHGYTNSTMANWKVTVTQNIRNGAGTLIVPAGTVETFSDPLAAPPLGNGAYAVQNIVHGDVRWSIYNSSSGGKYLTVYAFNTVAGAGQYLSQSLNPPTYTDAVCVAWSGGLSEGLCQVTYTPIVYDIGITTSALPRVAFMSDVPSTANLLATNGNGSQLTGITAAQVGAYPSNNPSNFVTSAITNGLGSGGVSASSVSNAASYLDAFTPISYIAPVAPGATNVVTLSTSKNIYVIQATNTVNVMTNVASGISLNSQQFAYELWVNFTATNGLNMTWCPCMTFDSGTPDITVTGLYKFACSTINGTTVNARQIYPTPTCWRPLSMSVTVNNLTANFGGLYFLLANTLTNLFVVTPHPCPTSPVVVRWSLGTQTAAANSEPLWIYGSKGKYPPTLTAGTECIGVAFTGAASKTYHPLCIVPSLVDVEGYGGAFIRWDMIRMNTVSSGSLVINFPHWRPLNALENSAYNAGWRP